ncbi:MAG: M1 family aminopeptidase, partial [Anaerolineae bacterium]
LTLLTFAAGPARDFYLAASDAYTLTSETVGETTVNSYTPRDLAQGSRLAVDWATAAMDSYQDHFGPYPYTELDLVSTGTTALGVEYPGIIAINQTIYSDDRQRYLESTTAHEVAHQWFYNVVGNDQVDEPWIDEAMAQYATLLYYDDAYGQAGYDGFRQSLVDRWNRVDQADIPIGMPVARYPDVEYGAIVYGRGPLFFEALEKEMGQEAFDAFLRDYYSSFRWGIATADGLRTLAEAHCQCDLGPLFEAWVYSD